MSHIYRELPPRGEKIGIAFSGGLDTRTAVAWMKEQGLSVYAYTADLQQPDEKDPAAIPPIALKYGAAQARLVDAKYDLVREGLTAIQCGAFHLRTAGRTYFNTTPLGRVVTATAIVRAMQEDGVRIFSDGSTHKGNDIQRFYRYGLLVDPELMIYKPWLDQAFVDAFGGRAEMSRYLERIGLPYSSSVEKAYSTDSNLLGCTHEAKDLESLDESMHIVEPLMGAAPWDPTTRIDTESVAVKFVRGVPISIKAKDGAGYVASSTGQIDSSEALLQVFHAANRVAGRHGLGMSDQIENRVIAAKSRGIYEAPGMALLHLTYERLLSSVHNEETTELYQTLGLRLGRLLYAGKWFDPEALMLKRALTSTIAAPLSGTVVVELRRGDDYSILSTQCETASYSPEKLSMEKVKSAFTPNDRIGALEMQAIAIEDNRRLLEIL